jgi:hypothetical protein
MDGDVFTYDGTEHAPGHIVRADNQSLARLAVAKIVRPGLIHPVYDLDPSIARSEFQTTYEEDDRPT